MHLLGILFVVIVMVWLFTQSGFGVWLLKVLAWTVLFLAMAFFAVAALGKRAKAEDYGERHRILRLVYEECLIAARDGKQEERCRTTYNNARQRLLDEELTAFMLRKQQREAGKEKDDAND
jgi:hypothetical protein